MNGDVCRLCLGNENLIWIFDEKMAKNMPEIIEGTSGVQINKTDSVTQMVCSTCCQITIKMFKFKTTSIKNDKDLKAKCAGYNISQLTNANTHTKKDVPVSNSKLTSNVAPVTVPIPQKYKFAHPSIKDIIKKYPSLKLPEISLKAHFGAYITLLTDEVDDWYREKNFSISDIEQIKKRALEYAEAQENCPGAGPRRKRRRTSSEVKICTNNKVTSPDKSTSTVSTNKKTKSSEDTAGKSVKSAVTRVNINLGNKSSDHVNNQQKENIEVNTKFQLNQSSNLDKSEIKEVTDTKVTSKASKPNNNNNNKQDVVKSTFDNTVKPDKKSRTGSSIPLKTGSSSEPSVLNMGSVLHSLLNAEDTSRKSEGEITLKSLLQGASQFHKIRNPVANTATSKNMSPLTDSSHKPHGNENESLIIEIDDTPSENEKFQQKKLTNSHLSLFTTRPFVKKGGSVKSNSKNRVDNGNPIVGELLILSDSDDDAKSSDKCEDQNARTNSSNNVVTEEVNVSNTTSSDTVTELVQNISKNVNKDKGNEKIISENNNKDNGNEKRDFIRSLELAPKAVNMPDLSLLSVTEKMNTLYTCNVCDSHFNSLKELKRHLRKIHTKCPFCHKRFRNLVNREEHIKNNCTRNISRFGLKKPKLELIRIDEVEEIRRKYVSAFKEFENKKTGYKKTGSKQQTVQEFSEEVESEFLTALESPQQLSSASSSPLRPNTPPTESSAGPSEQEPSIQQPVLAVPQEKQPLQQQRENTPERLPEQPLSEQQAHTLPQQHQKPVQSQQDEQPQQHEQPPQQESVLLQTTATTEILPASSQTSASARKDKSKIIESYDEETADAVRELEKFLENGPVKSVSQQKDTPSTELNSRTEEVISNATSVAGTTSNSADIICISDDEGETENNSDNVSNSKPKIKVINNDILNNLNLLDNDTDIIERILSEAVRRKNVGGELKMCGLKDIVDGGNTKIKVFKNLRKHLQHYKIPIEISYSPVLNVEYKYAKVPTQKIVQDAWPSMVPLDLKTTTASTGGTPTYSIQRNVTNTSCRNPSSVIVQPQASSSRSVISTNVHQSNLNRLERSVNAAHVAQFTNTQESLPSSHNLILTSTHNPMMSAQSLNHTLTTNGPVILNSTQNVYATSNCNNYSNFIILPTSLVTTATNATVTTLPATQGPLPVIQSVSSGRELETSLNNQSTPTGIFSNSSSTQPAIRVRDLSELS